MPLRLELDPQQRGSHFLGVLGWLKPGGTVEAAGAEMAGIARDLAREYPDSNEQWTVRVVTLREQLVGDIWPALLVLLGRSASFC